MIFNAMEIKDITQGEGADREETPGTSAEALQNLNIREKEELSKQT